MGTYARDRVPQPVITSGTSETAEKSGPCIVDPGQKLTGLAAAQGRRMQASCMLNTDAMYAPFSRANNTTPRGEHEAHAARAGPEAYRNLRLFCISAI